MQKSLKTLKQQSIISSDEIQSLRHTLLMTHPNLTKAQHIRIFTNYFHAKLDDTLAIFDRSLQNSIKRHILQRTHYDKPFTINVLDVVEIYSDIKPINPTSLTQLTSWVNQYVTKPFSEEYLLWLTKIIRNGRSLGPFFIQDFRFKLELGVAVSALCGTLLFSMNYHQKLQPTSLSYLGSIENITCDLDKEDKPVSSVFITSSKQNDATLIPTSTTAFETMKTSVYFSETSSISNVTSSATSLDSSEKMELPENDLHSQLKYKVINQSALKEWLTNRNSLLANEPYFSTIINTAQTFNVNPLLLFAITGQEQNFVPISQESASKIANNPFNLYGSWQEYNTSIEDSTRIAARTIVNLGQGCPSNEDQIKWINQQYASDPNWHVGVSYFLNELEMITLT